MIRLLLATLVGFAFASCATPAEHKLPGTAFDINRLLDAQEDILAGRSIRLEKEAGVNGSTSTDTLSPNAGFWTSELAIFRTLDAVNRESGYYIESGPLKDPQSNLLIRQFTSEAAPLAAVRVYYQDEFRRVRQVEGVVREQTFLYGTNRTLRLWFEDDHGSPVLDHYEIQGYQKVLGRDTVHFFIRARVRW